MCSFILFLHIALWFYCILISKLETNNTVSSKYKVGTDYLFSTYVVPEGYRLYYEVTCYPVHTANILNKYLVKYPVHTTSTRYTPCKNIIII